MANPGTSCGAPAADLPLRCRGFPFHPSRKVRAQARVGALLRQRTNRGKPSGGLRWEQRHNSADVRASIRRAAPFRTVSGCSGLCTSGILRCGAFRRPIDRSSFGATTESRLWSTKSKKSPGYPARSFLRVNRTHQPSSCGSDLSVGDDEHPRRHWPGAPAGIRPLLGFLSSIAHSRPLLPSAPARGKSNARPQCRPVLKKAGQADRLSRSDRRS